jgi:hypothetical protein
MMRVIDSSLLLLMVLRLRDYSSAYRLFLSISDDDMYHANSDWVWRQAIRTAWGNRWCVVSPERVSIVAVIVDDDPTSRLVSQTFAVAA